MNIEFSLILKCNGETQIFFEKNLFVVNCMKISLESQSVILKKEMYYKWCQWLNKW